MIIEKTAEEINSNTETLEEIPFTVESGEATAMVLIGILADLYSNPRQTVMWEYVSNALDSHHEAGKSDVPIDIILPNQYNKFFIVRDYGVSMDHTEIKTIFSTALKSMDDDDDHDDCDDCDDYDGSYCGCHFGEDCFEDVTLEDETKERVKNIINNQTENGPTTSRRVSKSTKPYVNCETVVEIAKQLGYNVNTINGKTISHSIIERS